MHWAEEYVGLPFKSSGRDRDGIDCYGLLALVMLEQFGIEVPIFRGLGLKNIDQQETIGDLWTERVEEDWAEVESGKELPGDAVNLVVYRLPHCGVVVGSGNMLHIREGAGAVIESYTRGSLCRRVQNCYRHRLR